MITATDNNTGAIATTTFTYTVNNVAPTIALTGNPTVFQNTVHTLNLGAVTDPGTARYFHQDIPERIQDQRIAYARACPAGMKLVDTMYCPKPRLC